MTMWKSDPLKVLQKAFDEALFLRFRETCAYLQRDLILEGKEQVNHCEHPENVAVKFKGPAGESKQLPGCFSSQCPVVEKYGLKVMPLYAESLDLDDAAQALCDSFLSRWRML